MLDQLGHAPEEARGVPAVAHAMIEHQRQLRDAASDDLTVDNPRALDDAADAEDGDVGVIDDRGRAVDTEPAVVVQGEGRAAQALGWQDRLGTLHAGKRADLVVIDARAPHLAPRLRPLGALVHTGQGRDVEYVVVEGEVVIAEGEPTRARSAEVVTEAQAAAEAVWRRAGGLPPAMVPRAR